MYSFRMAKRAHEPSALRGSWLAKDRVAVLSAPLPVEASLPVSLSAAERAVVGFVLTGLDNAEIARRRGVKPATIAKQLESAYRKLGVGSRAQLAALIASRRAR
jgi:DNA-binding CsgD family transcriptional regulator